MKALKNLVGMCSQGNVGYITHSMILIILADIKPVIKYNLQLFPTAVFWSIFFVDICIMYDIFYQWSKNILIWFSSWQYLYKTYLLDINQNN